MIELFKEIRVNFDDYSLYLMMLVGGLLVVSPETLHGMIEQLKTISIIKVFLSDPFLEFYKTTSGMFIFIHIFGLGMYLKKFYDISKNYKKSVKGDLNIDKVTITNMEINFYNAEQNLRAVLPKLWRIVGVYTVIILVNSYQSFDPKISYDFFINAVISLKMFVSILLVQVLVISFIKYMILKFDEVVYK